MMKVFFPIAARCATCLAAALLITLGAASAEEDSEAQASVDGEPLEFTHVLDDSPLDVLTPRPNEAFTDAVTEFHVTGINPYSGDAEAIAEGRQHYNRWCQACHLADGSGRIGPPLNRERVRYPRAATDKGLFEITYGGAAGAMQPFGVRLDQDEILRLMAFLKTLRPS
jgi:cytochrome c-L